MSVSVCQCIIMSLFVFLGGGIVFCLVLWDVLECVCVSVCRCVSICVPLCLVSSLVKLSIR